MNVEVAEEGQHDVRTAKEGQGSENFRRRSSELSEGESAEIFRRAVVEAELTLQTRSRQLASILPTPPPSSSRTAA